MDLEDIILNEISQTEKRQILYEEPKKQTQKERSDLWLPESGGRFVEELDEGGEKAQTYSHEISKYWRCNVQRDSYNYHCCMVYLKGAKSRS